MSTEATSPAQLAAPMLNPSSRDPHGVRSYFQRVDPSQARPGDWVELGEPMATIFARDRAGVEAGKTALRAAITIADEADPPLPLVSHRVTAAGVELLVGT